MGPDPSRLSRALRPLALQVSLRRASHVAAHLDAKALGDACHRVATSKLHAVHFAASPHSLEREVVSILRPRHLDPSLLELVGQCLHLVWLGMALDLLHGGGNRLAHVLLVGPDSSLEHLLLSSRGLSGMHPGVPPARLQLPQPPFAIQILDLVGMGDLGLPGVSLMQPVASLEVGGVDADVHGVPVRAIGPAVLSMQHPHALMVGQVALHVLAGIGHAPLRSHLAAVERAFIGVECDDAMVHDAVLRALAGGLVVAIGFPGVGHLLVPLGVIDQVLGVPGQGALVVEVASQALGVGHACDGDLLYRGHVDHRLVPLKALVVGDVSLTGSLSLGR